jgi:hypothetical protein
MEKKIMYGHHNGLDFYWDKISEYEVVRETDKQVEILLPDGRITKVIKAGKLFNSMEEAAGYAQKKIQGNIDAQQSRLNYEKEKMVQFKKLYNL